MVGSKRAWGTCGGPLVLVKGEGSMPGQRRLSDTRHKQGSALVTYEYLGDIPRAFRIPEIVGGSLSQLCP